MPHSVFPDNTVLCNFAAVERLDLLEGWLLGKGRWVEAVAAEATRSAGFLPALRDLLRGGWLGEPVEFADAEVARRVDTVRRQVFGGTSDAPLKHLGEAQTCWLLDNDPAFHGSWWVTDDRDAFTYAKRRGIVTKRTIDIVRGLVADGDVTAQKGFDLMGEMRTRGRSLVLPGRPDDLSS